MVVGSFGVAIWEPGSIVAAQRATKRGGCAAEPARDVERLGSPDGRLGLLKDSGRGSLMAAESAADQDARRRSVRDVLAHCAQR